MIISKTSFIELAEHRPPTATQLSRRLAADFQVVCDCGAREIDHISDKCPETANQDNGQDFEEPDNSKSSGPKLNAINQNIVSGNPLSYEEFRAGFWPRFDDSKALGLFVYLSPGSTTYHSRLDPALVWSEFMGVIRGSEGSVQTPLGYLSQDQYLSLSHRTNATFSRQREQVYRMFEAYLRRKRKLGKFDPADRCLTVS